MTDHTPENCTLATHDHYDEDGSPAKCVDCGAPLHYDFDAEDYRHDDPNAKPCWLVHDTTTDHADPELLARALAYTDSVGLSDGTDRPASTVADVLVP